MKRVIGWVLIVLVMSVIPVNFAKAEDKTNLKINDSSPVNALLGYDKEKVAPFTPLRIKCGPPNSACIATCDFLGRTMHLPTCALGKCCKGSCPDYSKDLKNCGSCGHICGDSEICCSGSCVDLKKDSMNCGGCGMTCPSGQSCCNGQCKDISNDPKNCGTCGNICPTTCSGQPGTCVGGKCSSKIYNFAVEALPGKCLLPTPSGLPYFSFVAASESEAQACAAAQFPPSQFKTGDPSMLGNFSFAVYCSGAVAGCYPCRTYSNVIAFSSSDAQTCVQYQNVGCTVQSQCASCPSGQSDICGKCSDLQKDNNNCGTPGNVCPSDKVCCDGGCRDLKSDNNYCGSCESFCTEVGTCANGDCVCKSGLKDCDGYCIDSTDMCCHDGNGDSCLAGETCCGAGCCPPGTTCIQGMCYY